jgi:hypothetical protein
MKSYRKRKIPLWNEAQQMLRYQNEKKKNEDLECEDETESEDKTRS